MLHMTHAYGLYEATGSATEERFTFRLTRGPCMRRWLRGSPRSRRRPRRSIARTPRTLLSSQPTAGRSGESSPCRTPPPTSARQTGTAAAAAGSRRRGVPRRRRACCSARRRLAPTATLARTPASARATRSAWATRPTRCKRPRAQARSCRAANADARERSRRSPRRPMATRPSLVGGSSPALRDEE